MLQRVFSFVRTHNIAVYIACVSCCIALVYSFVHRITPVVDAKAYDKIAVNLLSGFGFREDRVLPLLNDPSILRAGPGYEFFLAGVYGVFGHHHEAVWVVQAFLHGLSAFLLYMVARRLFPVNGKTIGLVAAAVFAFWPDLIEISAMLMTETLYLFCTILILYVFVAVYEKPQSTFLAALLGFLTGIGILVRPPLIFFVPIIMWFFIQKKAWGVLSINLLSLLAIMAPWVIRNYMVYHAVILTTLIGDYNLWIGNTVVSNGGQFSSGINPVTEYLNQHGAIGLSDAAKESFIAFVWAHPLAFFTLCIIRTIRYFSLIRPMGFWFYQTGWPQMLMVASSLVWIAGGFVLGFAGMAKAWLQKNELYRYVILFALTAPIPLLITVVQSRYRFQIYPFLALFGAYMAVVWWQDKSSWRTRAVVIPTLALLVCTLSDIAMELSTIVNRLRLFF